MLDAMVSLKASLDAWDQIDSLLRRSLAAYAETLRYFEEHVCRPAAKKFKVPGVDFAPQRNALTRPGLSPADSLPVLESVGRAIEQQLRSYGQRLRQNGCSARDLRDVRLEHSQRVGIGNHEDGHLVVEPCSQVVDVPVRIAAG